MLPITLPQKFIHLIFPSSSWSAFLSLFLFLSLFSSYSIVLFTRLLIFSFGIMFIIISSKNFLPPPISVINIFPLFFLFIINSYVAFVMIISSTELGITFFVCLLFRCSCVLACKSLFLKFSFILQFLENPYPRYLNFSLIFTRSSTSKLLLGSSGMMFCFF